MNIALETVRVLVIDDDALSRELFSVLLQGHGYAVDTANSGDDALLHLRARGSSPSVILADLQMPGISGNELAIRLRELCGTTTLLLAMSASEPLDERTQMFDEFLLKPFSMDHLAAAIARGSPGGMKEAGYSPLPRFVALDEVVYAKLAASMKKDKLQQLYTFCLTDAEKRIAAMRRATSEGDDAAYRREAHSIKGGCGMLGAVELQDLASSMENKGIDVTNHVATLDEFTRGCERLRRILVALENRGQSSSLSGEIAHE